MVRRERTPEWWSEAGSLLSRTRYRRMLLVGVVAVATVALLPLALMSLISYRQYQEAFLAELKRPMLRFADAGKLSLESFLSEQLSALAIVTRELSYAELLEPGRLDSLLLNMQQTFGGIVDLGLIDEDGVQVAYAGPFQLAGRTYAEQGWFRNVAARGAYISDVFLGYRNLPHIVVAIHQTRSRATGYVLRATVDTDVLHFLVRTRGSRRPEQGSLCRRCHSLAVPPFSDAFIINRAGVLQTPSRLYGEVLKPAGLPRLSASGEARFSTFTDTRGVRVAAAYAAVEGSPFTLVLLGPYDQLHAGLQALRRDLVLIPLISALMLLCIIVVGCIYVVRRVRDNDRKRAALYHKMEYTNKLAAIGRLGAGVAHEINNPLSIITQKAGLLRDLLTMSDEPPSRQRMLELLDSVLHSADRCGGITHRLLGFAKHMDIQREVIDLQSVVTEVLGFLEKEASYREIAIVFTHAETPPPIVSDRGQLQQVFLNIINNAFAAVDNGGRIEIHIERESEDRVAVRIADNGIGIPKADLEHIFDPFFTTKKGGGTGLGLSITYGIVQKLGGEIRVQSEAGVGTTFTVVLPIAGGAS